MIFPIFLSCVGGPHDIGKWEMWCRFPSPVSPAFEVAVPVSFLKPGAFLVQGVTTFPTVRALHRLGALSPEAFAKVFDGLLRWLGKSQEP
jgi:hypothetical protein